MLAYWEYKLSYLKSLHTERLYLEEIAETLNCSVSKAKSILYYRGLKYKKRDTSKFKKVFNGTRTEVIQKLKTMTMKQLAIEKGCTLQALKEFMKQNKINTCKKKSEYNKRLSTIYDHMKERCYKTADKSYKYYGARGIKICKEWLVNRKSFYAWAVNNGYADNLTLDRIDVNVDYTPSNCRWITIQEQNNNKRNSKKITYKGETLTVAQWAKRYKIEYKTLYDRLFKFHWNTEDAFMKRPKSIITEKPTK